MINIKKQFPTPQDDMEEFDAHRVVAIHIWNNYAKYSKYLEELLKKYPHIPEAADIEVISKEYRRINHIISDESGDLVENFDDVIDAHVKDIMEIYNKLETCFKKSYDEFNAYSKIRNAFIQETLKKNSPQ